MFENLGENLSKKLGPFPVWVWGVLAGGAFIAWYWFSGAGVSEEPVSEDEFTTELAPSGDFSERVVVPESDTGVDEATNEEWLSQAISAAAGSGGSQVAIRAALQKFLMGEELTAEERGWVDRALSEVGQPPEGTSGISEGAPDEEPEERGAWNPATKTTLTATKKLPFHKTVTLRVKVRWVENQGRIVRPFGKVSIYQDGRHFRTLNLINGDAITTMVVWAGNKATTDKRIVWTAKYTPTGNHTGGAVSRPSSASPVVTQITN